jgi:hypothetical protein
MKAWIGAVALVGMLVSSGAMAAKLKYDGNELLGQCQQAIKSADSERDYDRFEAGACAGFVMGVQSTVTFFSEFLNKEDKFCMPDNVTNSQMVRIVVKYLKDNPKNLNLNMTGLVWAALKDAYPCK